MWIHAVLSKGWHRTGFKGSCHYDSLRESTKGSLEPMQIGQYPGNSLKYTYMQIGEHPILYTNMVMCSAPPSWGSGVLY